MTNLWKLLEAPWISNALAAFGLAVGLAGILHAVANRKFKRLAYYSITLNLVDSKADVLFRGLEIFYESQKVQSLKKSWLTIWNSGTDTVLSSDVAPAGPLRLICKGGHIIKIGIRKAPNAANSVRLGPVEADRSTALISFDYFDPKEGVQLEVWHTGKTVKAEGAIIGGGPVVETLTEAKNLLRLPSPTEPIANIWNAVCWFALGVSLLVFWSVSEVEFWQLLQGPESQGQSFSSWLGSLLFASIPLFLSGLALLTAGVVFYFYRFGYPKALAIEFNDADN